MIGPLRNRTMAISLVAILQLIALGYFVWDREVRVRKGSDIVLEVVPVDPRSLFQGDYVILGYPISTVKAYFGATPSVGQELYITVVPDADGNWQYARYAMSGDQAAVPGGVVLKGRVDRVFKSADGTQPDDVRLVYGLERFFVPEGKGLDLEALVRDKKLAAVVSVWRDGSSTLKGLKAGGKMLYETGVAAKRPEDVPPLDAASQVTTADPQTASEPPSPPVDAPAVETPQAPAPVEPGTPSQN